MARQSKSKPTPTCRTAGQQLNLCKTLPRPSKFCSRAGSVLSRCKKRKSENSTKTQPKQKRPRIKTPKKGAGGDGGGGGGGPTKKVRFESPYENNETYGYPVPESYAVVPIDEMYEGIPEGEKLYEAPTFDEESLYDIYEAPNYKSYGETNNLDDIYGPPNYESYGETNNLDDIYGPPNYESYGETDNLDDIYGPPNYESYGETDNLDDIYGPPKYESKNLVDIDEYLDEPPNYGEPNNFLDIDGPPNYESIYGPPPDYESYEETNNLDDISIGVPIDDPTEEAPTYESYEENEGIPVNDVCPLVPYEGVPVNDVYEGIPILPNNDDEGDDVNGDPSQCEPPDESLGNEEGQYEPPNHIPCEPPPSPYEPPTHIPYEPPPGQYEPPTHIPYEPTPNPYGQYEPPTHIPYTPNPYDVNDVCPLVPYEGVPVNDVYDNDDEGDDEGLPVNGDPSQCEPPDASLGNEEGQYEPPPHIPYEPPPSQYEPPTHIPYEPTPNPYGQYEPPNHIPYEPTPNPYGQYEPPTHIPYEPTPNPYGQYEPPTHIPYEPPRENKPPTEPFHVEPEEPTELQEILDTINEEIPGEEPTELQEILDTIHQRSTETINDYKQRKYFEEIRDQYIDRLRHTETFLDNRDRVLGEIRRNRYETPERNTFDKEAFLVNRDQVLEEILRNRYEPPERNTFDFDNRDQVLEAIRRNRYEAPAENPPNYTDEFSEYSDPTEYSDETLPSEYSLETLETVDFLGEYETPSAISDFSEYSIYSDETISSDEMPVRYPPGILDAIQQRNTDEQYTIETVSAPTCERRGRGQQLSDRQRFRMPNALQFPPGVLDAIRQRSDMERNAPPYDPLEDLLNRSWFMRNLSGYLSPSDITDLLPQVLDPGAALEPQLTQFLLETLGHGVGRLLNETLQQIEDQERAVRELTIARETAEDDTDSLFNLVDARIALSTLRTQADRQQDTFFQIELRLLPFGVGRLNAAI
jgi:hypothetical protein